MQAFEKYYQKLWDERLKILKKTGYLNKTQITELRKLTLDPALDEAMIENFITEYHLPEGLALNYVVDGQEYIVPMVTEEPSVIAAASNGARLVKAGGGFHTLKAQRLMLGQIIFENVSQINKLVQLIKEHQTEFLTLADQAHPSILKHGGGARWLRTRVLAHDMLSLDLAVDVQEAMGANMLNTMLEAVANELRLKYQQDILMSIMTNYATESLVSVEAQIPVKVLTKKDIAGIEIARKITQASRLAQLDPYRATTNNKGIMNGVDAVTIASGNDWRAIEAGVHAYAARNGQYQGLSQWHLEKQMLIGRLTLPMPVGAVGGSIKIVPLVKINHHLLKLKNATQLATVITSVGLGQNLAALYALVTEGIQRGHMRLQLKSLAVTVGARPCEIDQLVTLLEQNHARDSQTATILLQQLRESKNDNTSFK